MVHQTMKIKAAMAIKASNKITSIAKFSRCGAALILGALAACSTVRLPPETGVTAPAAPAAPAINTPERPRAMLMREHARWISADWSELPGWGEDRAAELWPALLRGCERPAPGWGVLCARASLNPPADDAEALLWLMQHLQPWRVETPEGEAQGLLTGYFEPSLEARRKPEGAFQVPLLAPPPDLKARQPWYTRQQIDTEPLKSRLKPIAWIEDPIDLQVLQIQGSGRIRLPDGQWRRMAFAGHNDQPLRPLGVALAAMGEWTDSAAAPRAYVREWAKRNPQRLKELLWSNPRYVFFREEPLPDPSAGPRGSQGVPLTPGRSAAVDKASIPFGTPLWLDSSDPAGVSMPLRRLVMAQDTGSAIVGAARVDYFWGWGAEAEAQASRTKQPLRVWALWPR